MASPKDNSLEDDLTCCVCAEVFEDPVMLLCGHDLCRKCCEALQKQALKKQSHGKFHCPECRAEVLLDERGIDALPRNFRLQNLCDKVRQMKRKNSMDHQDQDDPYSTLSISYMRRKGSVINHMASLGEKIKEMERFIKALDEKCETVEKNCSKLKVSISKECDSLSTLLDQKRKSMITDIDKHKIDINTQLRRQIAVYNKALTEAKHAEVKVKNNMESMKQKEFIKNTKSLQDSLDNASDALPTMTPAVSDKFVISVDFKSVKEELHKLRIDVRDKLKVDEQEEKKGDSEQASKSEQSQVTSKPSKESGSRLGYRRSKKQNQDGKKKYSPLSSSPKDASPAEPICFETAT
ncbi:tripartite motif-containing protein 55-like [Glandiceps talaboti]